MSKSPWSRQCGAQHFSTTSSTSTPVRALVVVGCNLTKLFVSFVRFSVSREKSQADRAFCSTFSPTRCRGADKEEPSRKSSAQDPRRAHIATPPNPMPVSMTGSPRASPAFQRPRPSGAASADTHIVAPTIGGRDSPARVRPPLQVAASGSPGPMRRGSSPTSLRSTSTEGSRAGQSPAARRRGSEPLIDLADAHERMIKPPVPQTSTRRYTPSPPTTEVIMRGLTTKCAEMELARRSRLSPTIFPLTITPDASPTEPTMSVKPW